MTVKETTMTVKRLFAATVLLSFLFLFSCKKDKDESGRPGGNKTITEVIPAEFVNELKAGGMKLYTGNTPPEIEGIFEIKPYRFDFANYTADPVPPAKGFVYGYTLRVQFSGQKADGSINVLFNTSFYNTLQDPFITGEGNNFSVCFNHSSDSHGANFRSNYEYVISGTLDGNTIKNLQFANVGLSTTENSQGKTVKGQITINSDADGVSEKVASLN